jgi:hypothetical protein
VGEGGVEKAVGSRSVPPSPRAHIFDSPRRGSLTGFVSQLPSGEQP